MYNFLVWDILQPFTLLCLLMALALLQLWRKRREPGKSVLLLALPFILFLVLSTPVVADLALGSLEGQVAPLAHRPTDVQAIVVLSSYIFPARENRLQPEPDESTFNRCLKAAELYHEGKPCPVLVSGGKANPALPDPALADGMRDLLIRLGVHSSDILMEDTSTTTYENAVNSQKILAAHDLQKIVLVTDAPHLPRAAACFRKLGLEVVPCGCRYRAGPFEAELSRFLPSAHAAQECQRACHEWLGTAWYWFRGRI